MDPTQDAIRALLEGGDLGVQALPARVSARASSEDLLSIAKERSLDAAVFDEFTPVFWSAQISNNQLDAYFTVMAPSSLKNYEADAKEGVAFQDSHRTDGLARTFGASLDARYTGGKNARVEADFYALLGLDPGVDAFWNKARGGIARDVSIGFYGGEYRCSICGKDMLRDWSCWHFPGWEYDLRDEKGEKTGERATAVATIENARLAEVSTVYDGATPGAMVLKAYREAAAGRLRPAAAALVEARYRIKLPTGPAAFAVPPIPDQEDESMTKRTAANPDPATGGDDAEGVQAEAERAAAAAAASVEAEQQTDPTAPVPDESRVLTVAELRALLTDAGLDVQGDPLTQVRSLCAEVQRLRPEAEDGRQYKADLIATALGEGVRALGGTFNAEVYRTVLEKQTIAVIRHMSADWTAKGDEVLRGGRQTGESHEPPNGARRAPTPAGAYRA